MSAAVSRAQDDLVDVARGHIREAVEASKGFPADPRLEKAQVHLVAAMAEIRRYQEGIS